MTDTIQQFAQETRKAQHMTLIEFADALNEQMPPDSGVTYSLINRWERGSRNPTRGRMELMVRVYPEGDWRHDFAAAMIEALSSTSVTLEPAG